MGNSKKRNIYQITLSSLFLSLSVIFAAISKYVVPLFHMPNGGSISLVMMFLTLASLILGPFYGLFVSLSFSLINLTIDGGFSYNWMSIILDYLVAFSCSVVCSIYRKQYFEKKPQALIYALLSFAVLRFICHFFSGVLIEWNGDVGSLKPNFELKNVIYSITYNMSYILPSTIICAVCLISLAKPLFILNDTVMMKEICPYSEDKLHFSKNTYLSFEKILFTLFVVCLIGAIVGCIPYKSEEYASVFSMFYLGYISLAVTVIFDVFLIVKMLKKEKDEDETEKVRKKYDIFLLVFSLFIIGVSILSILSYFTYGYDVYHS